MVIDFHRNCRYVVLPQNRIISRRQANPDLASAFFCTVHKAVEILQQVSSIFISALIKRINKKDCRPILCSVYQNFSKALFEFFPVPLPPFFLVVTEPSLVIVELISQCIEFLLEWL